MIFYKELSIEEFINHQGLKPQYHQAWIFKFQVILKDLSTILKSKDREVKKLMNNLETKGSFKLTSNQRKIIQKDFSAFKDEQIDPKKIIKRIPFKT